MKQYFPSVPKLAILFCFACMPLMARDSIIITVTDGSVTLISGNQVTVTGVNQSTSGFSSLDDAVDALQRPEELFGSAFTTGTPFEAYIDIFGFNMKIDFDILPQPTVTVSFYDANGNLVTTNPFTGATQIEAFDGLEAFFESDAGKEFFNDYMRAVQAHALLNFVSGPESPVGQSVRENTERAMGESLTQAERKYREEAEGGASMSISASYAEFDQESYSEARGQYESMEGVSYTVPISIGGRLGKVINYQFRIPMNYTEIEETEFYRGGMEFDLGVHILGHSAASVFEWEVTPTVGTYIMGTADLAVGGDIYYYGLQNRLQLNGGPFSVSLGSYYGDYASEEISFADLDIDLEVDDIIISHGLKLMYRLGDNVVFDIYGIQARPEQGDGYKETQTLGAGVTFRLNPLADGGGAVLRVGYSEDTQDEEINGKESDFVSRRLSAELAFRF